MTKFANYRKVSKNVSFMIRVVIAWLLIKLRPIFGINMRKIANKICQKKVLINSKFWSYLVQSLNEYGQMDENYEPEIWKIIRKNIDRRNDNYLINVWCNIWRRSIAVAKEYWFHVIAFEPAPETFDKLRINIALSKLIDKFELYNVALWDKEWTVNFEYKPFHNWSSQIVKDVALEWWEIIQVPVKRFDDLWIEKEKIEKTRLIIMDVEGFELNVLKWMEKSLKEFKDINIIVEIWDGQDNKEKTINYMKSLWYKEKPVDKDNRLFTK